MTDQPGYQPPSFDKPDGSVPPAPPTAPGGGGYTPPPADGGGYAAPAGGSYAAPAYGAAPAAPQSGYGAPQGYGQPQGFGQPPMGGQPVEWPVRMLSGLLDYLAPAVVYFILAVTLGRISGLFTFLSFLGLLAFVFYNAYLNGSTGQSFGKKVAGTRLVSEESGQLIGGGMGIARYLLHFVDFLPCLIGYLAPLFTPKKQTFADMILKTIVVKV